MKKSSNLILLAGAGVVGYFLYKRWKDKQSVTKDLSKTESEEVPEGSTTVEASKEIEEEVKPSQDEATPKLAVVTTTNNLSAGIEKAKEILDNVKSGIVAVRTKTGKKALVRKKRVKKSAVKKRKVKKQNFPIV